MAQKHGLPEKYTDFNNDRYAYIWCSSYTNVKDITLLIDELKMHDIDVMQTNLLCTGIKIE